MLSPTGEAPSDILVNSAHEALGKKTSPIWPTVEMEGTWYSPIGTFLNNCVDACHDALDGSPESTSRDFRWYNRLRFIVYDRTTEDVIRGASPIKPALLGGLDLVPGERVVWNPQNPLTKQVLLPVEVRADWAPVVFQAAAYALCLFNASPPRQFSVALGFHHVRAELRFLVFHRGGLTGSKPLSVKDEHRQKDIIRILLSILNWRSVGDAGFPEFYNDLNGAPCISVESPSPLVLVQSSAVETNTPDGNHACTAVKHT